MYSILLLHVLAATSASASPLAQQQSPGLTGQNSSWTPASGTTTTCDNSAAMVLGPSVGPLIEPILNNACAAMMPKCAYPDRAGPDTFCIATITWPLSGPKTTSISANLNNGTGGKIGGWRVQFDVTPPVPAAESVGAQWTVADCYGYFAYMLEERAPQGCRRAEGFGVGNVTVGGTPSLTGGDGALAGTQFKISIVQG